MISTINISYRLFVLIFDAATNFLFIYSFLCTPTYTQTNEKAVLLLLRQLIKLAATSVWQYPSNYTMPTGPAHIYQCCLCAHIPGNLVLLSCRLVPRPHTDTTLLYYF